MKKITLSNRLNLEKEKSDLLTTWALQPYHGWLENAQPWLTLILKIWMRLPSNYLKTIFHSKTPLIFLPPTYAGRVIELNAPLNNGALFLQLDEKLLSRPAEHAEAILAHELGHAYLSQNKLDNSDLNADALVCHWGLTSALYEALKTELAENHPRILALARSNLSK